MKMNDVCAMSHSVPCKGNDITTHLYGRQLWLHFLKKSHQHQHFCSVTWAAGQHLPKSRGVVSSQPGRSFNSRSSWWGPPARTPFRQPHPAPAARRGTGTGPEPSSVHRRLLQRRGSSNLELLHQSHLQPTTWERSWLYAPSPARGDFSHLSDWNS